MIYFNGGVKRETFFTFEELETGDFFCFLNEDQIYLFIGADIYFSFSECRELILEDDIPMNIPIRKIIVELTGGIVQEETTLNQLKQGDAFLYDNKLYLITQDPNDEDGTEDEYYTMFWGPNLNYARYGLLVDSQCKIIPVDVTINILEVV